MPRSQALGLLRLSQTARARLSCEQPALEGLWLGGNDVGEGGVDALNRHAEWLAVVVTLVGEEEAEAGEAGEDGGASDVSDM